MTGDPALLRRIEASLREAAVTARDAVDAGPFRILVWPGSDLWYLNYGVPVAPEADWDAALAALPPAFAAVRRRPRLELLAELRPELSAALARAGWGLERRAPVMVLDRLPRDLPSVPGVAVEDLHADDPEARLAEHLAVQAEAFGFAADSLGPDRVADLRMELSGPMAGVVATEGGRVVAGAAVIGVGEVGELVGVGTATAARRRGLGTLAAAAALRRFHARGGTLAWLSAGDDGSERIYARLGFRRVGTQENWALPV
jgi:ribosomal protein S18 acetylase RimI-like enzyme